MATSNDENWYKYKLLNTTVTAIVVIGLYLFIRIFLNSPQQTEANKKPRNKMKGDAPDLTARIQYSACNSPNCVRCSNYRKLRENPRSALEDISIKYQNAIRRLSSALETGCNAESLPDFQKPNVLYLKDLESKPLWMSLERSIDVDTLEIHYPEILEDYMAVWADDGSKRIGWTKNTSEQGSWFTYYIINQGQVVEENARRCPFIYDLVLNGLRDCMSNCVFGNVFISVLRPGTTIEPHYGPCNARIRCHLGLRCPSGWQITVDGISQQWAEGRSLLFDDSFLHYVSDESTEAGDTEERSRDNAGETEDRSRAVLIVDFWHPDLNHIDRDVISQVFKLEPVDDIH